MLYGLNNGVRIEATPNAQAVCQCCNSELIPKCGNINVWHWSHKFKVHCDDWYEPETQWHKGWKNEFPKDCQEVVFKDELTGEKHVADVYLPKGLVLEFQNSNISSEEIQQRENFYKKMIWVINGDKFYQNLIHSDHGNFLWKHRKKCWLVAKMPIFISFTNAKIETSCFRSNLRETEAIDYSNSLILVKEFTELSIYKKGQIVSYEYNFIGQKVNKYNFIKKYFSYL